MHPAQSTDAYSKCCGCAPMPVSFENSRTATLLRFHRRSVTRQANSRQHFAMSTTKKFRHYAGNGQRLFCILGVSLHSPVVDYQELIPHHGNRSPATKNQHGDIRRYGDTAPLISSAGSGARSPLVDSAAITRAGCSSAALRAKTEGCCANCFRLVHV